MTDLCWHQRSFCCNLRTELNIQASKVSCRIGDVRSGRPRQALNEESGPAKGDQRWVVGDVVGRNASMCLRALNGDSTVCNRSRPQRRDKSKRRGKCGASLLAIPV
jgi:hypothetical protein